MVVYLSLGLFYALRTPMFGKPDELYHYAYANYLRTEGRLPTRDVTTSAMDTRALFEPEAHQGPLYYAIMVAFGFIIGATPTAQALETIARPNPYFLGTEEGNRQAYLRSCDDFWSTPACRMLYTGRLISVAFGALAVASVYLLGRGFLSPGVATLGAVVTAFNPQFLFIASSFSNDMAGVGLASLALWRVFRLKEAEARPRDVTLLGVLAGLASLAKLSGFLLVPLTGAVLLLHGWRSPAQWRRLLLAALLFLAVVLALVGPWFWSNWQRYGDPTGLAAMLSYMGERQAPPALHEWAAFAPFFWKAYWLDFSIGGLVFAEGEAYWAAGSFVVLGVAGLAIAFARNRALWGPLGLLGLWLGLVAGSFLVTTSRTAVFMGGGRLLFPAAASIALGLAVGWRQVAHLMRMPGAAWLPAGGLLLWAAMAPGRYLEADKPALLRAVPPHASTVNARLVGQQGERIELLAYEVRPAAEEVGPGQELAVTVYWRALDQIEANYAALVQLVLAPTHERIPVADVMTYPGYGSYPTRQWRTGDIVADRYYLTVPQDAVVPRRYEIMAGMLVPASVERLVTVEADGARRPGRMVPLVSLRVVPRETPQVPEEARLTQAVRFAPGISLMGFASRTAAEAGAATFQATLYWRAEQDAPSDFTVFLHAYDEAGRLVAQHDGPPAKGMFPPVAWRAGDLVVDERSVPLPAEAGEYRVYVGVYDWRTGVRFAVWGGEGQRYEDDGVMLGMVEVPGTASP